MLILVGASIAAEPVLAFGEADLALERAQAVAGDVELARVVLGVVGAESRCNAEPTLASELEAILVEADRELAYLHTDEAGALLVTAGSVRGCLSETATPELLARLDYLRGVQTLMGCEKPDDCDEAATAAFLDALTIHPGLTSDENYELSSTFSDAQAALGTAPRSAVRVFPADAPVYIDGRLWTKDLQIAPGNHIVQIEADEGWETRMAHSDGELVLLLTGSITDADVGDPSTSDVGRTLAASTEEPTWLVVGDVVYRWSHGTWQMEAQPFEVADLARPLRLGGAGVAGAGAVVGASALSVGLAAKRNGEDWESWVSAGTADEWNANYVQAEGRVEASNAAQVVGWSLVGVGLVGAGVGTALDPEGPVSFGPATVEVKW